MSKRKGSDSYRKGRRGSQRMRDKVDKGREEKQEQIQQQAALELGDFVSELALALRYRERSGLDSGDWVEEPERLFTDGLIFGEEVKAATEGKLQITLTLDASMSMWTREIMKDAAPTFQALHRMIMRAKEELPEGTLLYAPFIFHEEAHRLPGAYTRHYEQIIYKKQGSGVTTSFLPREYVLADLFWAAKEEGYFPAEATYDEHREDIRMFGTETYLAPLFLALAEWEQGNDPNATRLDIVITDGLFESDQDLEKAARIQEGRGGRHTTVLLNFLPVHRWENAKLPEQCLQYPVTRHNLEAQLRTVITEAVQSLL